MKNNKWIVSAIVALFLATIGGTWAVAGMVYELKVRQAVTENTQTRLAKQVEALTKSINRLSNITTRQESKLEK